LVILIIILTTKGICSNVTPKKKKKKQFITIPVPWQLLLLLLVVPFWRPSEIWRCCEKAPEAVYPNTAGYKAVSRRGSQLLQPINF
jgi:hypothetical protein